MDSARLPQFGDQTDEIVQRFRVDYSYPVAFTADTFSPSNDLLAKYCAVEPGRHVSVMPIIDSGVAANHPQLISSIEAYFDSSQITLVPAMVVPGGEACKNAPELVDQVMETVAQFAIDRHSYIIAIGGGAVLDFAGFAAAIAHRGIRLIRMPTTVLAQNDAGVGVKNAVNAVGRKNFVGTFAPPHAVINDSQFLATLCDRDLRSGLAETVKVALIKDKSLFERIFAMREPLARFADEAMDFAIREGARLHLQHIGTSGDPFERGSARPLDFGHWSAHKIEQLSGYALRHGEAVAAGILLDSIYSHLLGSLDDKELSQIVNLYFSLGFELPVNLLNQLDVVGALEEFREHLGGQLTLVLLDGIGAAYEVNTIDLEVMQSARSYLCELQRCRTFPN